MKRIAVLALLTLIAMSSYADDPLLQQQISQKMKTSEKNLSADVYTDVYADVVSRYVWRGYDVGGAAIQPSADLFYKGLNLNLWVNFGFNMREEREFDIDLSYTIKGFSVGVTDLWTTGGRSYFDYSSHRTVDENGDVSFGPTHHTFEGRLAYDFDFLCIEWHTVFAGNDGANKSGNRAYSSYFEVSTPFKLLHCDWVGAVGVAPWASTMYENTDGFSVINLSLRCTYDIHIYKKFYIPIFGELSANPCTRHAYFMAGFTIAPWRKH